MEKDFRSLFDRWSVHYDETVSGHNEEYAKVFEHYALILEEVAQRAISPVLEFGVGTGNLTEKLVAHHEVVYGIEPSERMRAIAKDKLPQVTIKDGHFLNYRLEENVQSIVSTYAFHHLTDQEKFQAIQQFNEVLPYGGKVVFADTVFINEEAKEERKKWAVEQGYDALLHDLNTEFYSTIPMFQEFFENTDFFVEYEQLNEFVWLIEAKKEKMK